MITLDDCYRPVVDPRAPHQLGLRFVREGDVQGVCNCGVTFAVKDPTHPMTIPSTRFSYDLHIAAVLEQQR